MKMKTVAWMLSAVAFTAGPVLAESRDTPPAQPRQKTIYSDPAGGAPRTNEELGTQMPQSPPTGWTTLAGKVQSFDRTSQTLQLRDNRGNLYVVPVDSQVTIRRNGNPIDLALLSPGDTVDLTMNRHP